MNDTASNLPPGSQGIDAFAEAIGNHAGILRKVAATYCSTEHDRADLIQDILVQLLAARGSYDPQRPLSTWMYRLALNVAISQVRSRYRQARVLVPIEDDHLEVAGPGADHEGRQERALLDRAMHGLDPLNRAIMLLYLDGYSQAQIGEIVGISASNAGTKIARIKQQLRSAIGLSVNQEF
ncbi:MAG: sigma-70 family RNA polymerase sigma factor [Novosphingobium sp.]|uniref:RNA polymerase sigma factor n=1 Tax=Novosphingobium sp. TaxID=1874826 RepID=UPI001D740F1D|nr:sigma-70 family RNA polymerase sigma factor [Novosphingobium sp.]MCB2058256.1 sigma-70 family RNA polymerase sigma factor [Novosphingobium sp.]MCP5386401.1 sigma-70 family RNA polymerase sigma factor [Novosphingobium sp.]